MGEGLQEVGVPRETWKTRPIWWNDVFVPLTFSVEGTLAFPASLGNALGITCPKVMLISDRDGEMSLCALLALQLFKCFAYNTITALSSDYWHHQHHLLMDSELLSGTGH